LPAVRFGGNIEFRRICLDRKQEYSASRQHVEKDIIARSIVEEVHRRGGRFLRRAESRSDDKTHGDIGGKPGWVEIEEKEAIEKTKQTMRDTILLPPGSAAPRAEDMMAGTFSTTVPSRPRVASIPSVPLEKPSARLSGRQLEHACQDQQQYSSMAGLLSGGHASLPHFGATFLTQNPVDYQQFQQSTLSDQYQRMAALSPVQRVGVMLELPRAYQDILPFMLANRELGQAPLSASDVMLLHQARQAAILLNDFARAAQVDAVFHSVQALMGREAAELQGLLDEERTLYSGSFASLPLQLPTQPLPQQQFADPMASNSMHHVSSHNSSVPQHDERKPPAKVAAAAAAAHEDQSAGNGSGRGSGEGGIIGRTSHDLYSSRAHQGEMGSDSSSSSSSPSSSSSSSSSSKRELLPLKKRAKRNSP